jgi:hypothetical protein
MHANAWVNFSYVPAFIFLPLYQSINVMFIGNVGSTKRLELQRQVDFPVRRGKQSVWIHSGDRSPLKADTYTRGLRLRADGTHGPYDCVVSGRGSFVSVREEAEKSRTTSLHAVSLIDS